ncbi:MAG TPA: hypothetical protein VEZ40_11535 [Pyrinomonadaceae bacterium]|nr:hypothetical protein [Pyrinomonadaceae bacterium]
MANDNEDDKTPAAGKGGSPASSTPNEQGRGSGHGGGKETADSRTPKESKESAGGKGGGLH